MGVWAIVLLRTIMKYNSNDNTTLDKHLHDNPNTFETNFSSPMITEGIVITYGRN